MVTLYLPYGNLTHTLWKPFLAHLLNILNSLIVMQQKSKLMMFPNV